MKNKPFIHLIFLSIFFFLAAGCIKHKSNPIDQLPPATQTGSNTLGFLLNGEPWTPKGWSGSTTNLSLYYDEFYNVGTFNIATYRLLTPGNKQSFATAMDSFKPCNEMKVFMVNKKNV